MSLIQISHLKADGYQLEEAYRSLRTNIEFCGDNIKVIAITSCHPNEGKSMVSVNIAISFAELGKRVLLIDSDFRKSVNSVRMNIDNNTVGFTHYLTGKASSSDVIMKTDVANLDFIYSGVVPPNPTELLANKHFKDFLESAKAEYDYVFIDTPPLGAVIDCAVVAPHCDGAILVIATEEVSYRLAQAVKDQLIKTNCRVLGAVLNKVDVSKRIYSSRYSIYGRKYYGMEKSKEKK